MDLSQGFQTSSTELLLFFILLGAMVAGLVGYQFYRNSKRRAERRRKEPPRNPILSHAHQATPHPRASDLSRGEQQTLDHLAWLLRDPRKRDELLENEGTLVKAARRAILEGIVTERDAQMLMRRLDIDTNLLAVGSASTRRIPIGADVSVSDAQLRTGAGEVVELPKTGVLVKLSHAPAELRAGTDVEVLAQGGEGMYRFQSRITMRDGKQILLRHTNHVETVQRRRYRRRNLKLPVEVRFPGLTRKPLRTTTEDLSAGGTAMRTPKRDLAVGMTLECILEPDSPSPLTVSGTVVRTSNRERRAHLRFGPLADRTRHRLFRLIMRAARQ